MKIIALFIIMILGTSVSLNAQDLPAFESLKLNSSPGFILLGIEPDNIQRPGSPAKFIGGILNSTVNGKLRPNIAFEVSPYYQLHQKPLGSKILEKDFLQKSGFLKTIGKTLSLSFATSESDTVVFGKLKPGTGLGAGIRFLLIDGKINGDLRKWNEQRLKAAFLGGLYARLLSLPGDTTTGTFYPVLEKEIKEFTKVSFANLDYYGYTDIEKDALLQEWKDDIIYNVTVKKLATTAALSSFLYTAYVDQGAEAKKMLTLINAKKNPLAKEGFMLEFAAGRSMVFQKNEWGGGVHAKTAFWLTPSWRINFSKDDISLLDCMGVARYTINNKKDSVDIADYFDIGIKAQFTQNYWSASLEFVNRWATRVPATVREKYTYRLAAGIDYKISEVITLKFSFGSNFDGNTKTYTDPKQMFALGGLNIGMFKPIIDNVKN